MNQQTIESRLQNIFKRIETAPLIGPQQLCILGGRFPAARLPKFVELWEPVLAAQLPWRTYEYVSRLLVEQSSAGIPLTDLNSLERARSFGEAGDLDLRRDLATIHWHFIGDPATKLPDFDADRFEVSNYWIGREHIVPLRQFNTQTMQWRPNDDRVGGAWKGYAGLVTDEHDTVNLKQIHYVRAGRVEFVRLIGFEKKESKNGNGQNQED